MRRAEAGRHLAGLAPGSWPVVLLDPMFTTPLRGPPGYEVFRRCAVDAPLTPALLAAAARVAAERVVVKAPVGWAPPPDLAELLHRRIRGKALELAGLADLAAARLAFYDLSIAFGKLLRATGVPSTHEQAVEERALRPS